MTLQVATPLREGSAGVAAGDRDANRERPAGDRPRRCRGCGADARSVSGPSRHGTERVGCTRAVPSGASSLAITLPLLQLEAERVEDEGVHAAEIGLVDLERQDAVRVDGVRGGRGGATYFEPSQRSSSHPSPRRRARVRRPRRRSTTFLSVSKNRNTPASAARAGWLVATANVKFPAASFVTVAAVRSGAPPESPAGSVYRESARGRLPPAATTRAQSSSR